MILHHSHVLQLVMPMLSKAKKQYLCASNVYYDRGRIVAVLPFFPFLDSFFFTFPLKTPSGMTGKPTLGRGNPDSLTPQRGRGFCQTEMTQAPYNAPAGVRTTIQFKISHDVKIVAHVFFVSF